jgi:hypothetical protein
MPENRVNTKWKINTDLDGLLILCLVIAEVPKLQRICPVLFVKVHEHGLFKLRLPVIHSNRIVVSIQTVNQCLNAGLLDVANVGRRLSRLNAHHDCCRRNSSECVYHDLSFDGLDWVHHDSYSTRVHHFESLLSVYVDTG